MVKNGNIDFVFTGHAHGGQFRIPFLNIGLMSPSQGLFPKYTSGIKYTKSSEKEKMGVKYSKNNKTGVIISRGIGNTTVPYRIFNPSEIIYFKLKVEK